MAFSPCIRFTRFLRPLNQRAKFISRKYWLPGVLPALQSASKLPFESGEPSDCLPNLTQVPLT
jgi:hypothetical protein